MMTNQGLIAFLAFATPIAHAASLNQSIPPGLLVAAVNPGNVPPIVNSVPGQEAFYKADSSALNSGRMTIVLPDGIRISTSRKKLVNRGKQFVWMGSVKDDDQGSVTIARRGDALAGTIRYQGRIYRLEPTRGGLHRSSQMKTKAPAPEIQPVVLLDAMPGAYDGAASSSTASANILDILVSYTPAAETAAGGTDGILALIDLAVAETNMAYENSGIDARLRLIHTVKVNYDESGGLNTALSHLGGNGDGYMDDIHALRDQYGADLVSMIVDNPQYCGISYVGPNQTAAFSVVHQGCATGYYSFGHEIGHIQGSQHDRLNSSGGAAYPYAYGYRNPDNLFRTIMAYDCTVSCLRTQNFSNPDVYINGHPSGIDHDLNPSNSADNARSITNTAPVVASFRTAPGAPTQTPAAPDGLHVVSNTHDQVDLAWNDNADDESGHLVERSTNYSDWNTVGDLASNITSFSDRALEPLTLYYYRVSAYNNSGFSENSTVVNITTSSEPMLPLAPASVTATLTVDLSVRIDWTHDTTGNEHFEVVREKKNKKGNWTSSTEIASLPSGTLSTIDHPDSGTYRYSVRTTNSTGGSDWVFSSSLVVPKSSSTTGGKPGGSGPKCNPRKNPSCQAVRSKDHTADSGFVFQIESLHRIHGMLHEELVSMLLHIENRVTLPVISI